MQTQAEIGPLIQQWMAAELDSDARLRTDMSWAQDHVRPGETPEVTATRMLHGEAMASLDHWQDVVARADWRAAEPYANALIARNSLKIEKDTPEYRFVCRVMALARLEVAGVQFGRCDGHWGTPELPYGLEGSRSSNSPVLCHAEPSEPLSVLIPKFLDEKKRFGRYQPKRLMDFQSSLDLFRRFVGNDLPVSAITKKRVGEFRGLLIELPSNATKRFRGLDLASIREKAKEHGLKTLAAQTINTKYLSVVENFFHWCISNGSLMENPASGIRVPTPKSAQAKVRRPFQSDHLDALFKAPLFTGCKSNNRIYKAGSYRVSDHRYWLPLLALFTGAREGELCQLRMEDIRQIEGVWCIDVNRRGGHLKSRAAERIIPVHPELARIGFLEHVKAGVAAGRTKLFAEIKIGASGYASDNPSKWFARVLNKTFGEDRRRADGLTFHSFRHTFKDALREAGVEERIQDVILGHESDHVSGQYGSGYKAPRLHAEICKVKFDGLKIT